MTQSEETGGDRTGSDETVSEVAHRTDGGTSDSIESSWIWARMPSRATLLRGLVVAVVIGTVGVAVTLLVFPTPLVETPLGRRLEVFLASLSAPIWFVGQAIGAIAFLFVLAALVGVWRSDSQSPVEPPADDDTADQRAEPRRELDEVVADLQAVAEAGERDDTTHRLAGSLRTELEDAAVTVLARAEGCSVEEATQQLADGTWTDDPRATCFFRDGDPPWHVRLRDWLSATPGTVRRAEHVVAELERLLEANGARVDRTTADGQTPPDTTGTDVAPWQSRHSVPGPDVLRDTHALDPSPDATESDDTERRTPAGSGADVSAADSGGVHVRMRSVGNAAGLFAVAVGVGTATPLAVLLGVLGVVYGLLDRVTTTPTAPVEVTREIGSGRPSPGDLVEVRLTVTNTGADALPDVRVVDGVPEPLAVLDGSPGIHTALRPGESDSVTYTVRAKRGTFAFDAANVVRRNVAGTNAVGGTASPETPIRCSTLLESFPLHDQARAHAGRAPTDRGGEGIEFYATREYRRGDPSNRINWNQLAKTGELTTIEYRNEGTATVVLLVDARDVVSVGTESGDLDGLDLSVYAAERTLLALLAQRVGVGVLVYDGETFQHDPPDAAGPRQTRLTATLNDVSESYDALSESDVSGGRTTTAGERPLQELRRRLSSRAQVVLFSPAVDEFPLTASRTLQAAGHATTVFSPANVGEDSLGQRTSRLERACLLQAVRETGAYVVDWDTDESVETAVTRVARRHRS